jgi:hypothetical protein
MNAGQRREYQNRLGMLARSMAEGTELEEVKWPRLEATAEPQLDAAGRPLLRLRVGDNPVEVGLARENIVSASESPVIAQRLLLVRLREELRRNAPKVAQSDIHSDLKLLEELHRGRPEVTSPVADAFSPRSGPELQ